MAISVRKPPYIIPEYSLTGDLLAYLTCGLQYRYQNKGSLPPAMPVQLWFGNFIHGVMEEAFLRWKEDGWNEFPWSWETQVREIELEIDKRLKSRGLQPPPNLFCSFNDKSDKQGLCPDHDHPHKLVASIRADKSINTWGPHLFPLVDDNEVKLKGIRDMPNYKKDISRSNYYGVTGIVDVLTSVTLKNSPKNNLLIKYLNQDKGFVSKLKTLNTDGYEVIVDYKGMNRPSIGSPAWEHHHWQVQTYAWLRNQHPESKPVMAGILFYLNELCRFKKDLIELKKEVQGKKTDVMPTSGDLEQLLSWTPKNKPPILSEEFRNLRSVRIIPIDSVSMGKSLKSFDGVVGEIESSILKEINGDGIQNSWHPQPERRTCDACDFRTFCSNPEGGNKPTVP